MHSLEVGRVAVRARTNPMMAARAAGAGSQVGEAPAGRRRLLATLVATAVPLAAAVPAAAQPAPAALGEIEVVGTTPLPGLAVPRDAVPANVQTGNRAALEEERASTLADFMNQRFGSVYVNEAQSNPFQPDLLFRGFSASPLLGNPIGLSVFFDGVRINESFGDTVLWDLIPSAAIENLSLVPGSNPVFGLNTLGGSIGITTRSGRTSPGLGASVEAGSFGRRGLEATYGHAGDSVDAFLSAEAIRDDGWRDRSPSEIRRFFGKLGWSSASTDVSLSYAHAANELTGNGLVPESLYRQRRQAIYTYPDTTTPTADFLNLAVTRVLDDRWKLSGNAYYRKLKLRTFNGDAEFDDGGTPADPTDDAYEGENRSTRTTQTTSGVGIQLSHDGKLAGLRHRFAVGASLDRGRTRFEQFEQDGEFTADRGIEADGDPVLDTAVTGRSDHQSLYLTDTVSVTDTLDLTLSGRYVRARVRINDDTGLEPALDGDHRFSRFSPAIGAAWRLQPALTLYGGFNEGFRVPTPVELTCADPDAPCSLPVAFVADPPLKPVVARTFEIGLRGRAPGGMAWNAGLFRSDLRDDILFTSTGAGRGFFSNVPKSRREGIELGIAAPRGDWRWFANYSYTRATYQSDVDLFNGVANEADPTQPETTAVSAGSRLPGVPSHLLKAGLTRQIDGRLSVGGTMNVVGNQYLRGDEGNRQLPLGGYAVFNLRADYRLTPSWRLFGRVHNVFDRRYATLGGYNRVAFDADSRPLEGVGPGPVNRFVSPGMPRAIWLGVEYRAGK